MTPEDDAANVRADAAANAASSGSGTGAAAPPAGAEPGDLLRRFAEQSDEHVFIGIDPQGQVMAWLGGAEQVLGYREDEIIGQPIATLFVPEDRARHTDSYELDVARTSGKALDDRWHQRRDGTRIWMTGTVTALRDEAGAVTGYVKLMRDRTDLRAQIEVLENRVKAAEAERTRMQQALGVLGHELRSPLTALQTATVLGRLPNAAETARPLHIIERQVGVVRRLADDLLDVQRIESDKIELNIQRIDLLALLSDCVQAVTERAAAHGVQVVPLFQPAPIWLTADAQRLQQVVSNLLDNALKYTPSGGHVWLKAIEEGDQAVIRVEDTGMGIEAQMLPRIFELFTQERRAIDRAKGGLGIGLALVRQFVELHGGIAEARSAGPGKGSQFTVRLPLQSGRAAPQ